jgi:hypothetical protein
MTYSGRMQVAAFAPEQLAGVAARSLLSRPA